MAESEARYSQEVVEHSKAIQALDEIQRKMAVACNDEEKLRKERDAAVTSLADKSNSWQVYKENKEKEMTNMTTKLTELEKHNEALRGTLQQLNAQLSLLQASVSIFVCIIK